MTMLARLICRRRGHRPESIFVEGGPPYVCRRCRRMVPSEPQHLVGEVPADWVQVVVPPPGDAGGTWAALEPLRAAGWEWALTVDDGGEVQRWANDRWAPVPSGSLLVAGPDGRMYCRYPSRSGS